MWEADLLRIFTTCTSSTANIATFRATYINNNLFLHQAQSSDSNANLRKPCAKTDLKRAYTDTNWLAHIRQQSVTEGCTAICSSTMHKSLARRTQSSRDMARFFFFCFIVSSWRTIRRIICHHLRSQIYDTIAMWEADLLWRFATYTSSTTNIVTFRIASVTYRSNNLSLNQCPCHGYNTLVNILARESVTFQS